MFAPLNGAPLNGGAAGLWVQGDSHASASVEAEGTILRYTGGTSEAVATAYSEPERVAHYVDQSSGACAEVSMATLRTAFMSGVAECDADSSLDGRHALVYMAGEAQGEADDAVANRVTRPATAQADAEAAMPMQATRLVWQTGELQSGAESSAAATRYAMQYPQPEAEAESSGTFTRLAFVEDHSPGAEADALGHAWPIRWAQPWGANEAEAEGHFDPSLLAAYRWMSPTARAVGRSWMDEAALTRLHVNQVEVRGLSVGRASTYAIPNATLGRGKVAATAETKLEGASARRPFTGTATAEAEVFEDVNKTTILSGNMMCFAETLAVPSVTRDGVRLAYMEAAGVVRAGTRADGLLDVWTRPTDAVARAQADGDKPYAVAFREGALESLADSVATMRVNLWRFAQAIAEGTASAAGEPPIRTTGVTVEDAEAWADVEFPLRVDRYTSGVSRADTATLRAVPRRCAFLFAESSGEARTSAEAEQVARRPEIDPAEASAASDGMQPIRISPAQARSWAEATTKADGLRLAWMDEGSVASASAAMPRSPFQINAEDSAPIRRTIVLGPGQRYMLLKADKREYRVR